MTPAEELAAAADKLDALASAATPGPWFVPGIGEFGWAVIAEDGGRDFGVETDDSPQGESDAEWIAAMNPLAGADQAALLREFAVHVERRWRDFHDMWNTEQRIRMIGDHAPGLHAALRIARRINGTTS